MTTLEDLVGRRLMIGIRGCRLDTETVRRFTRTHAAGLVLFARNFESPAQLRALISGLQKKIGRKLLTAVDHEGGRVVRFTKGVTVFPAAGNLGWTEQRQSLKFNVSCFKPTLNIKHETLYKQGQTEARELLRLGINLNLAPCADVLTERRNPVIGDRSYGSDPDVVGELASARIRGMQSRGLSACAKHFPGLGAARKDPHRELPVLSVSWRQMHSIHLKPFESAIRAGVDCVMTSHPLYPRLDPGRVPATFSRRLVYDLLRRELGFRGVILSDDLEMGALKCFGGAGEAACRAVEAGHDMVLVCEDPEAQRAAFRSLERGYDSGRLSVLELEQSARRVGALLDRKG